jgi:hypothetical protein
VGTGKNWKIPVFMPVLLRYISGPVLAIILSFAVPEFHSLRYDPLMILGFIASISAIFLMLIGFFFPRKVFCPGKKNPINMLMIPDSTNPSSLYTEEQKEQKKQ